MTDLQAAIVHVLKRDCMGRENALPRREVLQKVNGLLWYQGHRSAYRPIDDRTYRIAVRELRLRRYPICSTSSLGTWWGTCREDLILTEADMRSRARETFAVIDQVRKAELDESPRQMEMMLRPQGVRSSSRRSTSITSSLSTPAISAA